MWWISKTRAELAKAEALLDSAILDKVRLISERDYWKDKAEKLLDAALFKRGEVTSPVFAKPERAKASPFGIPAVLGSLNVHEIESAKPAAPVVPMK